MLCFKGAINLMQSQEQYKQVGSFVLITDSCSGWVWRWAKKSTVTCEGKNELYVFLKKKIETKKI